MGYRRKTRQSEHNDADPHARDGWVSVAEHASVYLGGKQYRDMREWKRPCGVCGVPFSIYEKVGAPGVNSRFSNRTCDAHRGLLPAFEKGYIAWDGSAVVAGIKCGKTDTAAGDPAKAAGFAKINSEGGKYTVAGSEEIQTENAALRKELAEAHEVNVNLSCELAALKRFHDAALRELEALKKSDKLPWEC